MKLTIFDLVIVTIFLSSTFIGAYSGFIKTTINLTTFVLSIIGTFILYPYSHNMAAKYIANEIAQIICSGIVSYIAALIVTSFVKHFTLKFTSLFRGNAIDRILGLIVGLIRGLLFCLITFWIAIIFSGKNMLHGKTVSDLTTSFKVDNYPEWFLESETSKLTIDASDVAISVLPQSILDYDLSKLGIDKMLKKKPTFKDSTHKGTDQEKSPGIDRLDKMLNEDHSNNKAASGQAN